MANSVAAKKAFIEILFWWVSLLMITVLVSFLKYPHIGLPQRILMSSKGVTLAGIAIMLLSRLLQRILSRVE